MPSLESAALTVPAGLHSEDLDRLGVTLGADGGTLRVWSEAADAMELVVFDHVDLDWAVDSVPLQPVGGGVWEITTPLLRPGTRYALRVDGPHGPGGLPEPAGYLFPPVQLARPDAA